MEKRLARERQSLIHRKSKQNHRVDLEHLGTTKVGRNCKRAGGKGVGAGMVSGPKKMRPVAWRVWCGEICIYTIFIYDIYIYNIHISADS